MGVDVLRVSPQSAGTLDAVAALDATRRGGTPDAVAPPAGHGMSAIWNVNPPALFAQLGRRVPTPVVSLHFVAGLELARRLKWLSPPPELDGRSFAITIEDLGLRSAFTVRDSAFRPAWSRAPCELELGAKLADLFRLIRAETDAAALFFQIGRARG
ncbi:hypothetical protein G6F68_017181 [Rhizopus microsporus]|nr:hypothetical protein G6F68_017181 [Rhizopus microsporus]